MSKLNLGNLKSGNIAVFLCDIQDLFLKSCVNHEEVLVASKKLLEATKITNLPLIVAEQYPDKLGNTTAKLDISHAKMLIKKLSFTMCSPNVVTFLKDYQIQHVILFGLETHICIQQTTLDLLQLGYEVHVVADATTSVTEMDRTFALQRLQHSGAVVTTSDGVIFQLIGSNENPKFKELFFLARPPITK